MTNIICYDSEGEILNYYTQWDINQKLVIAGADVSSAPDFHFLNTLKPDTYVVESMVSGNRLIVNVPDELLQYAVPVIAHIYYVPGTTEYTVRIPVMPRKRPDNYIHTDTESGGGNVGGQVFIANNLTTNDPDMALSAAQGVIINSLINDRLSVSDLDSAINDALNEARESGEFKGDPGEQGRGIVSFERTSGDGSAGSTDIYTITYSDNTVSTLSVYNGANGSSTDGGTGSTGDNGATFTPSIDSNGNLSWTNDKGLANPETVNIKGSPGETPERGVDYWTLDDISEIQSYVDEAILGGVW